GKPSRRGFLPGVPAVASILCCLAFQTLVSAGTLSVQVDREDGHPRPVIAEDGKPVFSPLPAPPATMVLSEPGRASGVVYQEPVRSSNQVVFTSNSLREVVVSDTFTQLGPNLLSRVVSVHAARDLRYCLTLGWAVDVPGP